MQLAIHAKIRIIFPYIVEFLLKNSDELFRAENGGTKTASNEIFDAWGLYPQNKRHLPLARQLTP
jgi:hypothetical protein